MSEHKFKIGERVLYGSREVKILGFEKSPAKGVMIEDYPYGHGGPLVSYFYDEKGNSITIPPAIKDDRFYTNISALSKLPNSSKEEALKSNIPESLVGRYVRALKDNPCHIPNSRKGDIFLITGIGSMESIPNSNTTGRWCYLRENIGNSLELMPEGFNPEESIKPEYIKGNWYKMINGLYKDSVIKFDKIQDRYIYFTEGFTQKGSYPWSKGTWSLDICDLEPFDISQYADKFPTNHELYKEKSKFIVGKWYTNGQDGKSINGIYAFLDDTSTPNGYFPKNREYFKPSTKEAYDKQLGPKGIDGHIGVDGISIDDLLAEAKRRYPPGTKYYYKDVTCTREGADLKCHTSDNGKYVYITDGYGGSVYKDGIWSRIVEYSKVDKWTVGGYVRITKDGSFKGYYYRIGEVWKVTRYLNNQHVEASCGSKTTILDTNIECEWIGMEKPLEYISGIDPYEIKTDVITQYPLTPKECFKPIVMPLKQVSVTVQTESKINLIKTNKPVKI